VKVLVIYNKSAGQAEQLAEIKASFSGHEGVSFIPLSTSLRHHVNQAVQAGCKVLVAAGGDGTVNTVLQEVMRHKQVVLGVIPVGTLNHFAQDLKVPVDVQLAAKIILAHQTSRVDVAQVENRYFVNNASIGFYPQLVATRENNEQKLGKWLALAWAFIKLLPKLRRYHLRLTYNGRTELLRTPFIFIGNNPYDIHARNFTKREQLTGGTLAVYVLKAKNYWELLRVAWRALTGTLQQETAFASFSTKELILKRTTTHQLLVAYDGEVERLSKNKAAFKLHPKALKVIVP